MAGKAKVPVEAASKRRGSSPRKSGRRTPSKKPASKRLVWRGITLRIRATPNYLTKGTTHLEIDVVTPKDAILPITETGYRSHFIPTDVLKRSGGELRFVLDWIEREARCKQWQEAEFRWRQGDLFASPKRGRR